MKVNNFNVYWEYGVYTPKAHIEVERECTSCVIEYENVILSVGKVGCMYKDTPNRRIARKESFKKAVTHIRDKKDKKLLWNAFIEQHSNCLHC